MAFTIKDIARECGVGVGTVSRVVNNTGGVSEKTREKVEKAIARFNYVPNASARNLVMSSRNNIGVLIKGTSNPFFMDMLQTVEREIASYGYTMVLRQFDSAENEVHHAQVLAKEQRLVGMLFMGGRFNHTQEELDCIEVPFVFGTVTNEFGDIEPEKYSSVSIDDRQAARKAIEYVYSLGHRKIGILASATNDFSISQLRYEGYVEALRAHGQEIDENLVEITKSFSASGAYEGAARLIKRAPDISCLFCISDLMGIGAIRALLDGGKSVPQDVSVISIDGLEWTKYYDPVLTTLCQPAEKLVFESVRLLVEMIEGKGHSRKLLFDTRLRVGGSVADINNVK